MFGSQILEIAIGMVFVYLSLSLICSGINEWIASVLQTRANLLEQWLQDLFSESGDIEAQFRGHPLIKALSPPNKPSKRPAYIPSRTFVLTLLDVIAPTNPTGSRTLKDIRDAVQNLPPGDIKTTMLALLDDAGNDAEKVRRNIEGWFNDAMERLSGLYKQRAKLVILVLSIGVTVLLNVNSLYVFNSLYHDGTLREAVVAAAEQAAAQPAATDPQAPITKIDQIQKELTSLNLPIGWTDANPRLDLNNMQSLLMTLLGWAITALAVSQGAPFWFDVLNKLVNVRTTGARPPTSSEPAPAPQVVVQPAVQPTIQPANGSGVPAP